MGFSFPGQNPKHIAKRAALQKASPIITPKQMRIAVMPFLRGVGKIFRERTREVQALNAEFGPKTSRSPERQREYAIRRGESAEQFINIKFAAEFTAFKQAMANKVATRTVMGLNIPTPLARQKARAIIRAMVLTWVNATMAKQREGEQFLIAKWSELSHVLGYAPNPSLSAKIIAQAKEIKAHYDAQTSRIAKAHNERKKS